MKELFFTVYDILDERIPNTGEDWENESLGERITGWAFVLILPLLLSIQ